MGPRLDAKPRPRHRPACASWSTRCRSRDCRCPRRVRPHADVGATRRRRLAPTIRLVPASWPAGHARSPAGFASRAPATDPRRPRTGLRCAPGDPPGRPAPRPGSARRHAQARVPPGQDQPGILGIGSGPQDQIVQPDLQAAAGPCGAGSDRVRAYPSARPGLVHVEAAVDRVVEGPRPVAVVGQRRDDLGVDLRVAIQESEDEALGAVLR